MKRRRHSGWRDAARAVTMEVYAVTREFSEWGKGFYNRLPAAVRNSLRSSGRAFVCGVLRNRVESRDTTGGWAGERHGGSAEAGNARGE